MSEENVKIVRRGYERLNDAGIDGFLEVCAPDVEFRDLAALPGSGIFVGHDAIRGWYAQLGEAFEDLRFEIEELSDHEGLVIVKSLAAGRGRGSGAEVELHFSSVWRLRDGELVHHVAYNDHAEALEASGLSE